MNIRLIFILNKLTLIYKNKITENVNFTYKYFYKNVKKLILSLKLIKINYIYMDIMLLACLVTVFTHAQR